MSHIRILVCRVDDASPDHMTELASADLPQLDPASLAAPVALDTLEPTTLEVGYTVLRAALQAQWAAVDAHLVEAYRQSLPPGQARCDGHKAIIVASRLGTLHLPRQVLSHAATGVHVMPGDAALPPHSGMVITRGLQEWACLLAQDLPFATAARLLGWQAREERVLSPTALRTLVRRHGLLVRAAERQALEALGQQGAGSPAGALLMPHTAPRRRAGWPAALTLAVEAALAHEHPCPPRGIAWADWARVLEARRADAVQAADLRHLGPEVEERQVLVSIDEVLTRAPARREFIELRTAHVATRAGYRYVSGVGDAFRRYLRGLLGQLLTAGHALLGIADCARWIRDFFADDLARIADKALLLDWYHLRVRCAEEASRACRGRAARARFLRRLRRRLWRGDVEGAVRVIGEEVPRARPGASLATFSEYLRARTDYIPDYRARWRARRYIGSGQVEKANDLRVARRQKGKGMHWSGEMSDALAALRTLTLNREWEQYWQPAASGSLLAAAA